MPPTGEHLYELVRKAYSQQRYRDALKLLDRNWEYIFQYAQIRKSTDWITKVRADCREILLTRQTDERHGKRRHRRGKLNPKSKGT